MPAKAAYQSTSLLNDEPQSPASRLLQDLCAIQNPRCRLRCSLIFAAGTFCKLTSRLAPCQHRLFDLGGELAMPVYQALNTAEVERLEAAIDVWNEELGPLENFILPGGSALIAQAHVCRCLARSAERRCQHLNAVEPLAGVGLAYINRLSDLLFVVARLIAKRQGIAEILWQPAVKPQG